MHRKLVRKYIGQVVINHGNGYDNKFLVPLGVSEDDIHHHDCISKK